jgi:hypothetical protein
LPGAALYKADMLTGGGVRMAMAMARAWWRISALGAALLLAGGCGAGNYGYSREYVPTDDEEPYYERAADLSYEEVRRDPSAFAGRTIGWFGVVTKLEPAAGGGTRVALDLRFHQPRHLCRDQFESSCKVTISERAGGPFSTILALRPEDRSGPERLNVGSLVKVYGSPTHDFDERGGPVLRADFYRQWPHGAYVTTSGRVTMRR